MGPATGAAMPRSCGGVHHYRFHRRGTGPAAALSYLLPGHFSNARRKRRLDSDHVFLIGFFRGRVADRRAWFCAFETLHVGGAAGVLAYGEGGLFKGIVA